MTLVLSMDVGVATHIGRIREVNEDAYYAGERLFAVADGMGGHAAGAIASRTALDVLAGADRSELTQDALRAQVRAANAAVVDYGRTHRSAAGLGTTIAGIALIDSGRAPHWAVFSIGDSRVYLHSDGTLRQLTVDHSEVEELIAEGALTREQARAHPARHIVTRAIGETPPPLLDVVIRPAVTGQRWLITSDGLTCELDDRDIQRHLDPNTTPTVAAAHLVEDALAAGGRDNVAVIVLDVTDADRSPVVERTRPRRTAKEHDD